MLHCARPRCPDPEPLVKNIVKFENEDSCCSSHDSSFDKRTPKCFLVFLLFEHLIAQELLCLKEVLRFQVFNNTRRSHCVKILSVVLSVCGCMLSVCGGVFSVSPDLHDA